MRLDTIMKKFDEYESFEDAIIKELSDMRKELEDAITNCSKCESKDDNDNDENEAPEFDIDEAIATFDKLADILEKMPCELEDSIKGTVIDLFDMHTDAMYISGSLKQVKGESEQKTEKGKDEPTPNVVDMFDPFNTDHLEAYQFLQKHGVWPESSELSKYQFPSKLWGKTEIQEKIVDAWIQNYETLMAWYG